MSLFVNTKTQECGTFDPIDLDDENWLEAPEGTQAIYWAHFTNRPFFYKIEKGIIFVGKSTERWQKSLYKQKSQMKPAYCIWGEL